VSYGTHTLSAIIAYKELVFAQFIFVPDLYSNYSFVTLKASIFVQIINFTMIKKQKCDNGESRKKIAHGKSLFLELVKKLLIK